MRLLDEDICMYFDDLYYGKDPQWAVKNNLLSTEEWNQLREFHNFFDIFTDKINKMNPERREEYPLVLNNPDFVKLCTLAQKALAGLKALQEKSVKE